MDYMFGHVGDYILPQGLSRAHFSAVIESCIPLTASFRREVQNIPDGTQKINATLLDIRRHPRMSTVEMAKRAIMVPGEDRHHRVLVALMIFAAQVVFESICGAAQQSQLVPASGPGVRSQSWCIGGGNNGKIQILR